MVLSVKHGSMSSVVFERGVYSAIHTYIYISTIHELPATPPPTPRFPIALAKRTT
jgi:hypothetical protein